MTLVCATLSAIPVHLSILVCLSPWALENIDRRRRAFLWFGGETVVAGKCRVAWTVACRPRDLGGLGIIDLRRAGVAFQVRWEWLRRTKPDSTWALLPAKREKAVAEFFQTVTYSVLGDGQSTLFWLDRWVDGRSLKQLAPALFASLCRSGRHRVVAQALPRRSWVGGHRL